MSEIELLELPDSETTCTICYAEFLDPDDLSVHAVQMHSTLKETTFKLCKFCTKYTASIEDYAIHIRDNHLLNLKCCKYCNRVFEDFDEYRKHEVKHYLYVAKGRYSCSQCPELFNNISELELHENKHHSDSTEGVFMNECLPMLSSLLNIRAQKFLQAFGEAVVYMCVKCKLTTADTEEYIQHLKTLNCQSFACDSCSSVFRVKYGLVRHFEKHPECHLEGKQRYKQCSECYKMFDIKLWRDHTTHCKAIKCKMCHVVFPSMYDLSRHQSEVHPLTVTLESCKLCHREFAGRAAVDKHVERAHKNDLHLYKYNCIYCGAIYKHPKKLFAHFYSTHKELNPYTCTICNKTFKIRKRFTIHIKLDHKSIGYTEFDKNYHVYFSDKKSDKPTVLDFKEPDSDHTGETSLNKDLNSEYKDDSAVNENLDQSMNDQNKVKTDIKVKFDVQEKPHDSPNNITADFMSATETDGNITEPTSEKHRLKRKRKAKSFRKSSCNRENIAETFISDSSDDEPLVKLQKKIKNHRSSRFRNATWNKKKQVQINDNKKRFICNICKKYCYTFQNYHNHVALHYKNVTLKCVKCSQNFSSKEELKEHCDREHSTSQLTQTLKSLLEKRKNGEQKQSKYSFSEKFQQTIKRVLTPQSEQVTATITEVKNKLSVQKFIESFTPEEAPKRKLIEIDSSVSMRPFIGPCKEPFIKMTKCNLSYPVYTPGRLAMPVRYREVIGETHKVTVREVSVEDTKYVTDEYVDEDSFKDQGFQEDTYLVDDADNVNNEPIPEVAHEVMLEDASTLHIPHRVVLPKLPKEYSNIHIAHLQAEAPYFKIVKVEQQTQEKKQAEPVATKKIDIKLPDGTKLVTVNPLAHLLGDTPVEKILEKTKSKYYTPKAKDFEVAIAKAMLRLEKPQSFPKKKRKKRVENE